MLMMVMCSEGGDRVLSERRDVVVAVVAVCPVRRSRNSGLNDGKRVSEAAWLTTRLRGQNSQGNNYYGMIPSPVEIFFCMFIEGMVDGTAVWKLGPAPLGWQGGKKGR
jgi:hypothetical protein